MHRASLVAIGHELLSVSVSTQEQHDSKRPQDKKYTTHSGEEKNKMSCSGKQDETRKKQKIITLYVNSTKIHKNITADPRKINTT